MVDFDNDATVGTPPLDLVRILILQRHYDVLEALELYFKQKYNGQEMNIGLLRARMITLFYQLQAVLKRKLKETNKNKKTEYQILFEQVSNEGEVLEEDILSAFETINTLLDDLHLTRFDTKLNIRSASAVVQDKARGYG